MEPDEEPCGAAVREVYEEVSLIFCLGEVLKQPLPVLLLSCPKYHFLHVSLIRMSVRSTLSSLIHLIHLLL